MIIPCSVCLPLTRTDNILTISRTDAVLNPSAALQSTVEDFLQALEFNPNPTLAELINFVLRACGSNDSVDADKVVDSDGIVDALDHFTEALKHVCLPQVLQRDLFTA